MSLSDTAEYWQDVKGDGVYIHKHKFTHVKGLDCGHFHLMESDELDSIDCFACKKLIEADSEMKARLKSNNGKREAMLRNRRRKKKGYRLDTIIGFGKLKGHKRTVKWILENDRSYFNWMFNGNFLPHPELDEYINK